jgi:hypothetical protein
MPYASLETSPLVTVQLCSNAIVCHGQLTVTQLLKKCLDVNGARRFVTVITKRAIGSHSVWFQFIWHLYFTKILIFILTSPTAMAVFNLVDFVNILCGSTCSSCRHCVVFLGWTALIINVKSTDAELRHYVIFNILYFQWAGEDIHYMYYNSGDSILAFRLNISPAKKFCDHSTLFPAGTHIRTNKNSVQNYGLENSCKGGYLGNRDLYGRVSVCCEGLKCNPHCPRTWCTGETYVILNLRLHKCKEFSENYFWPGKRAEGKFSHVRLLSVLRQRSYDG